MPAGRPTEYKDSYAEKAYKFCAKFGFDDKALGELFDVSERTINTWKQAHPEFLQSLKKGKDEYDSEEVENSLLKRAMGYEYVEEIQEISPRADPQTGEAQLRITRKITKQVVPDVTAQIFWLKNRQPDRWRDRSEMHLGGTVTIIAPSVKKPKNSGT